MKKTASLLLSAIVLGCAGIVSAAPADSLESGFLNPPDSAKPQTWWHWMNGNITRQGIAADLEAMKQIGLGGATIVNVDCDIPPGPVKFMTPEWRDDFKFAVQEANRLGLELCVENCAGWSSSGGPWNTAANAMQRLTSSETNLVGPQVFDAQLPQPLSTLGYYRDVAVLAFRAPVTKAPVESAGESAQSKLEIKRAIYGVMNGGGSADVTARINGLIQNGERSVVVRNDEMGGDPAFGQPKQLRLEFTLNGKPDTLLIDENEILIFPFNASQLAAARSVQKSSVSRTFVQPPPLSAAATGQSIPHNDVLDLTAKFTSDGRLKWEVPAGNWIVLRLGYTPIGINNHPAPREGEGLECDKMSKAALDAHWKGFMQKILDDIGPLAGKSLNTSLIDSYEVGGQDWTPEFREEFEKRRGYDPLRFLPAFTHRIVDSPEITERFLWDMRRTVADLFADNYFGHFAELCRQHGLLNATEPYTGPFESLQCGAPADVVMGEFWTGSQGHPSVKMAASIAHIYGKTIVGAESFTAGSEAGRWQNDPYSLKTLGDLMYCQGLNRYIFHRYAMQPWTNRWPGMTMGPWGFHFESTETWWTQGRAWIDYISHCQFMLQQGRAVADAAYFTGESAPVEMRVGNPPLPAGYDYDAVNADVLRGAKVENGRITLASGASYAVLILPPDDINLTPQTLARIHDLVRDGATVLGPRPQHSPGLENYPECDSQIKKLADELWGSCDGVHSLENKFGRGRIVLGLSLAEVFAAQNLKPDFEFPGASTSANLAYAHRIIGDADIYFVSNQRRQFDSAECTFRVSGKIPELWHPDSGAIEPAPVWSTQDGRTKVQLNFDPAGSVFVVFRNATNANDHLIAASSDFPAPVRASKLEIQSAIYTAVDGAGGMDVTAKLSALMRDGELSVNVNNAALGRDPALNHVKELRVDYTLDGKPGREVVPEGGTLVMPPKPAIGSAPQYEASMDANGVPIVKAWGNGRVELSTARGKRFRAGVSDVPAPEEISVPWTLSFPSGWGAPPQVELGELISWSEHTNAGVRYFSGTATYLKQVIISSNRLSPNQELWLDLGTVKNFAEVSLNGHSLGILWKPPFRVNITSAAVPGTNRLEIKVTDLWPNRLIGDEQLPADCEWRGSQLKEWPQWLLDGKPSPTGRFTFTTWRHYTKNSKLLPSGLLGPVKLESAQIKLAAQSAAESYVNPVNLLGSWIWTKDRSNGQVCQFWRQFSIPPGAQVAQARLVATADDELTVYLDGQELGRGADWRELFDFNFLAPLLAPGKHVLAVRAFNSFHFAGMVFGMQIELADGRRIEIKSDEDWRIVPNGSKKFQTLTEPVDSWPRAVIQAPVGGDPWQPFPVNINKMPVVLPVKIYFWQKGWFQITLGSVCAVVIAFSVWLMTQLALHRKERLLLQRERARIARDIHDDLGSRMTQLVLHGEVMQSELPAESDTRPQLDRICHDARDVLSTLDEILWAVNPRRDTLTDFSTYVCSYAEEYLKPASIQCFFDVDSEVSSVTLELPVRRALLMVIKEALNNIVKYSGATELNLRIKQHGRKLVVGVEDNGKGFDVAQQRQGGNGLVNMAERMRELGGTCTINSRPGQGCRIDFAVAVKPARWRLFGWLLNSKPVPALLREAKES